MKNLIIIGYGLHDMTILIPINTSPEGLIHLPETKPIIQRLIQAVNSDSLMIISVTELPALHLSHQITLSDVLINKEPPEKNIRNILTIHPPLDKTILTQGDPLILFKENSLKKSFFMIRKNLLKRELLISRKPKFHLRQPWSRKKYKFQRN